MRALVLACAVVALGACSARQFFPQADQCLSPTPREAKITKKAWM